MILSDLATVVIVKAMGMLNLRRTLNATPMRPTMVLVAAATTFTIAFALNVLTEIAALPNFMEDDLINLSTSFIGILAVGIIGPIAEELLFREAILSYLLRRGTPPWRAIIFSAIVFGILHFNPAQIFFAIGIGIVFGIIYHRTGNIVLTSLLHILNNCISLWQMSLLGEASKEASITEELGGTTSAICLTIASLLAFAWLLKYFCSHTTAAFANEPQNKLP